MNNLQHPDITAAERFGYPKQPKIAHTCCECDEPIYEGESAYYFRSWGWICEQCADRAYKIAE